jgi:hypothetical protein
MMCVRMKIHPLDYRSFCVSVICILSPRDLSNSSDFIREREKTGAGQRRRQARLELAGAIDPRELNGVTFWDFSNPAMRPYAIGRKGSYIQIPDTAHGARVRGDGPNAIYCQD